MLTDRQLFILQAIIDNYIQSAEPIGSRSISKSEGISYSPATIRNEMADLEELGYLEKPHSSSGRIPSEKGYRHYVDHMLLPHRLSEKEIKNVKSLFAEKVMETEEVVKQSATILSSLTSYASIVLGPEIFESKLKQIQIIPLNMRAAVAILVTDTGHVENHTVTLPESLDGSDLEKITNILNDRLEGVPLYKLQEEIYKEVAGLLKRHVSSFHDALRFTLDTLQKSKHEKVFYGGKTNLLSQPEFKDIDKVKSIFELLEQDDTVHDLLKPDQDGLVIKIGQENDYEAFEDCSIISAAYTFDGKPVGTVGIVGPTRMEYPRVIGLIQLLSDGLSDTLTNLYNNGK
ncbi:heat-inducible transcription repressor HrcA [Alteribacillus persepolensis]|uniref:Heat-inducible transcription repressor HrcA n=1 Tax=Alteribacillus persepolensis TaxID=568899 RepID=A0A1G8CPV4_9BACI|nr:heat-inducible transcriptional repressor HrcA [Alteribacillus persepolensis]SDH47259.1 heat-inducible transcription repressor HrcA [Alteribacillus persepolensis]